MAKITQVDKMHEQNYITFVHFIDALKDYMNKKNNSEYN